VPAPYYYYTVPEPERTRRCILTSDLCSIDNEDFFIRGCLEIPLIGQDRNFVYGVWMSVSRKNYDRYVEVFDDPTQSRIGPFVGWFSSMLPGYPDTLHLKVRAHLRDERTRPAFELEPTNHPLALEQRNGITLGRLQEIYETNMHADEAR
jgi:hypothetical protein